MIMMRMGGMHGRMIDDEARPQVTRELLKRVYGYARPYMGNMILVLSIIIFTSLINLVPPLLYRDLFDNVIPNKDFTRLSYLAVGMVGIPILTNLIDVLQRYLSAKMGEGIIFDLREALYQHLQSMSLRFFTHTRRGEIVSRFNNDVVGAQGAITNTLPNIITNTITMVATLVVMFSIEWRLALLSIIVLPLFILPARRVGRLLRSVQRQSMEFNANMSSIITETLTINGALLVKTFGRQKHERERYRETNAQVRDIGVRRALVARWFFMGLGIAATVGTALNYWAGGYMTLTGAISSGTIVAFVAYLGRLYGPFTALTNVQVEFATSMVSFERVFEYLDLPVEIEDKPQAVALAEAEGRIQFEDVSFDYMEANERLGIKIHSEGNGQGENGKDKEAIPAFIPTRRWALKDLSFEIEPGQLVALVGPSGGGKTTLTYLLPRLYDPTLGRITLDGHDLRDVTQESLAGQIGMVTQETYLFHDTIRANLVFARQDATGAELEAATKAANIHEFIGKLPNGLDTVVGERGYRLSGGEKQRMAIARVVLKDPRILILDEATSHLDSTSEALIQEALEPLMKGRTSLVIAHRLSTILAADNILVLDEGKLVEQGGHDTLIKKSGLYAKLYETQFRRERVRAGGK
jgi:ATP-binding cassette subfamily B protein